MSTAQSGKGFTGWHMLAIMLAFFGTIITVNFTMAWLASSSWSGMLSKNTYVASQDFNKNAARARAWLSQGFGGDVTVAAGVVRYRLEGPADVLARVDHVEAAFHRPVGDRQDFTVRLMREGTTFTASLTPAEGPWIVDFAAIDGDEVVFHQILRIVSEGD
jgi:nitrogen fixation protein FixH